MVKVVHCCFPDLSLLDTVVERRVGGRTASLAVEIVFFFLLLRMSYVTYIFAQSSRDIREPILAL